MQTDEAPSAETAPAEEAAAAAAMETQAEVGTLQRHPELSKDGVEIEPVLRL